MDAKAALESSSQKLSPQDIKNREFKKSALGYSQKEVKEFLELAAKALERGQRTEKELTEKVRSLGEELMRWKNRETEIVKLKEKAQQEADLLRSDAQREAERAFKEMQDRADEVRTRTEEWLEKVIAEVEETERQKHNFMTAFKSALDSHYALLRDGEAEGESLGTKLNHFLKGTFANANASAPNRLS